MNNLSVTEILEFAVFGLAVAQALTILLTIRRERDIDDLRELVDQQRLRLVELTAWLAGRNSAQPRQITSERETMAKKVPEVKPGDLSEAMQQRAPEDEAARAEKALNWQREIAARLQEGLKGSTLPIEDTKTPEALPDHQQTSTAEGSLQRTTKAFNWFRKDPDEPREIAEARKMVADLKGGAAQAGPTIAPKDLPVISPSTEEELQRATRAIDRLKEDVDKAREIASSIATSPEKREAK
jgi:hypothetical protein